MALPTSVVDGGVDGLQVQGPVQGKPVEFEIDTSSIGCNAHLTFQISGPSRTEIRSWPKEGERAHVVSFVPQDGGSYTLRVMYNETEVDGSPFTICVTPDPTYNPPRGNPQLCKPSGDGLRECVATEEAHVYVDATEAGLGKLTMSMQGPSHATITPCMPADSVSDKYAFRYTVEQPGDYILAVRWSGVDIPGSPFSVRALPHPLGTNRCPEPTGDPRKVVVLESEGLRTGLVHEWQTFCVDTKEAGTGALGVAVQGPGKCEIELERNAVLGLIVVKYRPSQPGSYTMHVSFAEEPVSGSPFSVEVVETLLHQEECNSAETGLDGIFAQ